MNKEGDPGWRDIVLQKVKQKIITLRLVKVDKKPTKQNTNPETPNISLSESSKTEIENLDKESR